MTNSAWARTCLECGTPLGSLFTRGTSLGGYLAAAWMVNTWQQSMQCKQPKDPAPCEQLGTTWEAFLLTETPLSSTGRAFDPCCQDCARTSTPRAALMATCSGQHHSPSWSYVHTHELLLQPSAHSSTSAEILSWNTKRHTGQTTGVPRARLLSQYR